MQEGISRTDICLGLKIIDLCIFSLYTINNKEL